MTVKKFAFADKLKHMPHVLYTNVRGETGRKHWMEYNMRVQGIRFTRIAVSYTHLTLPTIYSV